MSSIPDPVRVPKNPDTTIWRYMDFAKFVSLLDSHALFFSRSDLLGDPFEFTYPKANYDTFNGTSLSANNDFFLWMARTFAKQLFVSCWHINEYESTAMWEQYLKGDEGVAIQTTYRRLAESLQGCPYKSRLSIGMVNYVNYELDRINDQNILQFVFHKRVQFTHERELRAVIWLSSTDGLLIPYDPETVTEPENPPFGLSVPIKVETLIERIFISPKSPTWFRQLVESVSKKFNVICPVVQSSLAANPLR